VAQVLAELARANVRTLERATYLTPINALFHSVNRFLISHKPGAYAP
jgi:hypothetical protein